MEFYPHKNFLKKSEHDVIKNNQTRKEEYSMSKNYQEQQTTEKDPHLQQLLHNTYLYIKDHSI